MEATLDSGINVGATFIIFDFFPTSLLKALSLLNVEKYEEKKRNK